MEEKATGTILRVRPLTETSLIVEWLTPELGRISTVAKGARRPKSPFVGKLDLYYQCEFSFQRSRRSELHTLREIALQSTRSDLRRDIRALSLAAYAGNLLEQATESETPVAELCELFTSFLEVIPRIAPSAALLYAFEVRLLAELGHGPHVEHPSLSLNARATVESYLNSTFNAVTGESLPSGLARELHIFLFRSLEQAFGKVPASREKALRTLRS